MCVHYYKLFFSLLFRRQKRSHFTHIKDNWNCLTIVLVSARVELISSEQLLKCCVLISE